MSDHIPFEIQGEIMKKFPVKPLLQFRSVSKAWKSLIDSTDFVKHYSSQQRHLLVRYDFAYLCDEPEYVSIADDHTFPKQKVYHTVPQLVKMLIDSKTVGSSHGLLCLYGNYYDAAFNGPTAVLWNISVRKTFAVAVPNVLYQKYRTILGFGVCDETTDPKIVKITYIDSRFEIESSIPWQVEVFTLSTGAWRTPYSTNLPRKSFEFRSEQVVIDGFLYWIVTDRITTDGGVRCLNLIVSFDITSEEFREIQLPDALANHKPIFLLSISKLRESLVMFQGCGDVNDRVFRVWMMEDGVPKLFTKIYTICTPGEAVFSVLEFRKSGEPIIEILDGNCGPHEYDPSLFVYEPYSKHISSLEISGWMCSFSMYSYMETLLLFDQPDLAAYDI